MRFEIFAIDRVTRVRKGHSRQFCIRIWKSDSVDRSELLQVQSTHEISRYGRLLVMPGGILISDRKKHRDCPNCRGYN